jgi:DNA-binding response OmpR family regulator
MPSAALVLVVEDDLGIASNLRRALDTQGYEVEVAHDIAGAMAAVATRAVDLVLLDLGLPDGDGIDLCRHISATVPQLPVIILTARTEEIDVVIGLDAGAVDFIAKPFRLAELLARVRAHLRVAAHEPTTLAIDGIELDPVARRVVLDGEELVLRAKEFDLLAALMGSAGTALTRDALMSEVWDEHWYGSTKTLDVHIAALRRKIDRPGRPSRITTLRGVGYRFEREAGAG